MTTQTDIKKYDKLIEAINQSLQTEVYLGTEDERAFYNQAGEDYRYADEMIETIRQSVMRNRKSAAEVVKNIPFDGNDFNSFRKKAFEALKAMLGYKIKYPAQGIRRIEYLLEKSKNESQDHEY